MREIIEDRQHHLTEAAKKYSRGQISNEEYRAIERKYMIDYGAATLELGKRDIRQRVTHAIESFIFGHSIDKLSRD